MTVRDREIFSVTGDVGQVGQGSLYVCHRRDPEVVALLLAQARQSGGLCVAGVGEPDIFCEDTRRFLAYVMAEMCGNPQRRLRVIGVTGTNGKTTVAGMIAHILRRAGRRCELIGTNNCGGYTTPIPEMLFPAMARAVGQGCQDFVMEVSSHSLEQSRVAPIAFACAVFTNLSRDHLDYHLTMERYAAAKARLFAASEMAVINADDEYAGQMALACRDVTCYGRDDFSDLCMSEDGVRYNLGGLRIACRVPGLFSATTVRRRPWRRVGLGLPMG